MDWRRYVSWKQIKSWSCLACGECCSGFKIILTPYEYAKLSKIYGYGIVSMDAVGNPCVRQVRGRCIFQDAGKLCALQAQGTKPIACKMWPFAIRRKSIPECGDTIFQWKGEDYHVYVDRSYSCPGIGKGDPERLYLTIAELIEIRHNILMKQTYSTSIRRVIPPLMRVRTREIP